MVDVMFKLCKIIWNTRKVPNIWTKSILILLPKKGDLKECSNYRTISLICHASKILLKLLNNRLNPSINKHISEEQAGFRAGRSTIEQIFCLRMLAEKTIEYDKKLYNCFIDFQKAFDSVPHECLWSVLKHYEVPPDVQQLIGELYKNAESTVLVNGEETEYFKTTKGCRQGCILSPSLFLFYIEKIVNEALEQFDGGIQIGQRKLTNLKFADDIVLIDKIISMLQNLTDKVNSKSSKYGMKINKKKTETMTFCRKEEHNNLKLKLDQVELPNVARFKYLGSLFTFDNDCTAEINNRIALASYTYSKLKTIWKNKKISMITKIKILKICVFSTLQYGVETWVLKKEDQKRLDAFEMKLYRWLLEIRWQDRIKNTDIRKKLGVEEAISFTIKKRQIQWFGHVARMDGKRWAKQLLAKTPVGYETRPKGHPRKRYYDDINEMLLTRVPWTGKESIIPISVAFTYAEKREGWMQMRHSLFMPLRMLTDASPFNLST